MFSQNITNVWENDKQTLANAVFPCKNLNSCFAKEISH